MFSRQHRKARVLFGLSDILLTALAFEAAYQTRLLLHLEHIFFLIVPIQALVLGFAVGVWLLIGLWLGVYERLDSGDPRVILRDAFRQCAYGAVALVLFEFMLRLDLSRPFLALFVGYAWVFLFLFRMLSGPPGGRHPARIRRPAFRHGSRHRRTRLQTGRGARSVPRPMASASPVFWRPNKMARPPRSIWRPLTRCIPSPICRNCSAIA